MAACLGLIGPAIASADTAVESISGKDNLALAIQHLRAQASQLPPGAAAAVEIMATQALTPGGVQSEGKDFFWNARAIGSHCGKEGFGIVGTVKVQASAIFGDRLQITALPEVAAYEGPVFAAWINPTDPWKSGIGQLDPPAMTNAFRFSVDAGKGTVAVALSGAFTTAKDQIIPRCVITPSVGYVQI